MIYIYLFLTYLLGGIPFGLLICKIFKNIDIREHGSKNIGATNVARIVGMKYATVAFILDGLKSFAPVLFSKILFPDYNFPAFVLFSAVMGHIFSIWLKGKGGKGFSSAIWGLAALDYRLAMIAGAAWVIIFKIIKISAAATLSSMVIVTVASYFLKNFTCFLTLALMTAVIFFAHRNNLKRLLRGEEFGFGGRK